MELILLDEVKHLGKVGDKVQVADGYGRNFLLPRRMALPATPENLKVFENEQKARSKKRQHERQEAEALGAKIAALSLTISRQAGEEDKLFGSVTNGNVAEALEKEGFKIDKRKVILVEPIKALGIFEVPVQVHPEVTVNVKVWVVKE
jgi:large subunit ribosomal protein L9